MKTGRPKIDWKNLPYEDYPLENLFGKRGNVEKWIKGREEKKKEIDVEISKLEKQIQKLTRKKETEHQKKIDNWNREIKLIDIVIEQKSKMELDSSNNKITLVREPDKKQIRGCVTLYGKKQWCHIGKTHRYGKVHTDTLIGKMSEEQLCDDFRMKLGNKFKQSGKGNLYTEKELKKRRGQVFQHPVTKQVKKVTSKRLDELDEIKRKKEEKLRKQVPEHLRKKK